MKTVKSLGMLALATVIISTNTVNAEERDMGRGTGPVIYVTSQGLYYDSIVIAGSLPMHGNFQQLVPGQNGLETEFGPGTRGHLGGRWWIDINEDGMMNEGDRFFMCPLLGPGRTSI